MIVAVKVPAEPVVSGVGTVARGTPSNAIVIIEPIAKFCPFMAMTKLFVFFRPDCGTIVMEGFTVKVVWAELRLGLSSVASILWFPGVDVGIVNVAVNEPVADVIMTPGDVAVAVESNFMAMIESGAKLEPEIWTVEPMTPFIGFRVIDGSKTVKSADELSDWSAAVIL